jgi:anthranilate synthase component 1
MPPDRHLLDGWMDPWDALDALVPAGVDVALLESTDGSGRSILGMGSRLRHELPDVPPGGGGDEAEFDSGWIGWIGYEGDVRFLEIDRAVVFDHRSRRVRALGDDEWAAAVQAALAAGRARPAPLEAPRGASAVWRHDDPAYLRLIRSCQEAIERGDAYVLCLTNTATVDGQVDGRATYRRLRRSSRTHHGGYLRLAGTELLSASPERFVEVTPAGIVRSRPIKGTRARHDDPVLDRRLAEELRTSEKERAENLMIVDLVRNDLSRVARVGSVGVSRLFDVESYPAVHQLVSEVEAVLAPGRTGADAVRALFPAGSMTGAPKTSAIDLLASFEGGPRGLYSGAFGYFAGNGSVDLAMVIRSIVVEQGVATVGAGGGITALSDPGEELAEVKLKAQPLLSALSEGR